MAPLGSAPRRHGAGIWSTADGRTLTAAGAAYWEKLYRSGRTDGHGHIQRASVVQGGPTMQQATRRPAPAKPQKPTTLQYALDQAAAQGQVESNRPDVQQARRTVRAYRATQHATLGGALGQLHPIRAVEHAGLGTARALGRATGLDVVANLATHPMEAGRRQQAGVAPAVPRGAAALAGVLPHTARSTSDLTIGHNLTSALLGQKHSGAGLGLDVAMLPLLFTGPGRAAAEAINVPLRGLRGGVEATRAAREGAGLAETARSFGRGLGGPGPIRMRPVRTLQAGDEIYHPPAPRGRVPQNIVAINDAISRAMMGPGRVPSAIRQTPVVKNWTEEARVARGSARQKVVEASQRRMAEMAPVIAKTALKEGSPESVAHFWYAHLPGDMRNQQGLQHVHDYFGRQLADLPNQRKALEAEMKDVQQTIKELTKKGEAQWSNADYKAARQRLGEIKFSIRDLPKVQKSLGGSIAQLRRTIAANPELDPEVLGSMRTLSKEAEASAINMGQLHPVTAAELPGKFLDELGLSVPAHASEGDLPFYVHHQFGPRRQGFFPGLPMGRRRKPPGLGGQERELKLLRTGRLLQSSRIPAATWVNREQYRNALTAQSVLGNLGREFKAGDYIDPEKEMLFNPKGKNVPGYWKYDPQAEAVRQQGGDAEQALRQEIDRINTEFLGRGDSKQAQVATEELIKTAEEKGINLEGVRVVDKQVAERFAKQFAPAASQKGWKAYDRAVDVVARSLVFARPGYVPKNLIQNALMMAPHQGIFGIPNAARALQMMPYGPRKLVGKDMSPGLRQLYDYVSNEVGHGQTFAIGQEASKAGGKFSRGVSSLADLAPRTSAWIHEAAAEGLINPYKMHLSEEDVNSLLKLFTDPNNEQLRANIKSRANEAMADFERMTPAQRRAARRAFIIPGWLWAGTRYPIHFAATHPGRSLAMGYAAAGEPYGDKVGIPQVNKPIDEYFVKGLPSFTTALPGQWFGGGPNSIERVQSVLPYTTPIETIGTAAGVAAGIATGKDQGWLGARSPISFANPLFGTAMNIASRTYTKPSGETVRTTYQDAARRAIERLFPTPALVKEEISPTKYGSPMYTDRSRVGNLLRDIGVTPTTIDPDAALRTKYNEQGLEQTARTVSQKVKDIQRMDALGFKPTKEFEDAYKIRIERQRRDELVRRTSSDSLDFQRKALKTDLDYGVKLGKVDKAWAKEKLRLAEAAGEQEIKTFREQYARALEGPVLSATRSQLTQMEKQQTAQAEASAAAATH